MNKLAFIPANLKAARLLLGLSQGEMGAAAGMSQKDISLHEKEDSTKKLIPARYILALVERGIDMNTLFREGEVRKLSRAEQLSIAAEPSAPYGKLMKATEKQQKMENAAALRDRLMEQLLDGDKVRRLIRLLDEEEKKA